VHLSTLTASSSSEICNSCNKSGQATGCM